MVVEWTRTALVQHVSENEALGASVNVIPLRAAVGRIPYH